MLLQGEIGRLRAFVIALSVAALGCAASAVSVRAAEVRHYEQVSPAAKGDGDIIGEGLSTMASDAGDAAAFESRLNFGDAVGSGTVGRTTYVARRGAGGWSTHSVTPMSRPDAVQVLSAPTRVEAFADDLSSALVWAYDLPAVTDDTPLEENLYVEDTTTGALRTVSKTQQDPITIFDFLNTNFAGYSADAKHLAFVSQPTPFGFTRLLPDAAPGVPNLYKWDDGVLSLAGTLPDGSVPPGGVTVFPTNIRGTMSADGSRVVFMASPDGSAPPQLYLHVDGRRTVWVSEPERSNGDRTPANGIQFEGMTPDGNNLFFVSDDPLVDGDTAPGPDEYRFTFSADPASDGGHLTLLTNNGEALDDPGSFGGTLVGMSDDARRVYLHENGGTLQLWQEGVPGLTLVDPSASRPPTPREWLTLVAAEPGGGRVSPDGNWLAYIENGQMRVYDRRSNSLTCVSCPSDASVVPSVTDSGGRDFRGFRPRFLSDDGRVFFTSTGSLVPADTNGIADVYEYDGQTRTLSLLTSGKGVDPAMFVDASRSGNDVFVVTRAKLVRSDQDNYVDLYDVRVGAALPDQPADAPACEGEACHGAPSASPADESLGSLSLEGDNGGGAAVARLGVRRRVRFRGAAGLLSVRLSGAGRVVWAGRGVVSGSLRHGSAGTVKLRVRLGKGARARLRRLGHYSTTVRLTFHAANGASTTASVHVTFRVAAKGR